MSSAARPGWRTAGAKAQVLITHGRSEYGKRYRLFAQALVRAGYRVDALGHRGHGESALKAGTMGDFGLRGFAAVVEDLVLVARGLRELDPGLSVLLFGHSMGSFVAQYVLLDHLDVIHALVLSGLSATDLRHP